MISNWNSVVVSNKIDGLSGLQYVNNGSIEYISRGDGHNGTRWNIGKYVLGVPKKMDKNVKIRGEITINRDVFSSDFKYFKTSRNAVCGILNRDVLDPVYARKLTFVAYEVVEPRMHVSQQMEYLQKKGYITPDPIVLNRDTDLESRLKMMYKERRHTSDYDIDGLVVTCDDEIFSHNESGNPDYSFAFKMLDVLEKKTTRIIGVEWNASKDGYLKPVAILDPVTISNVKISRVTLKNAAYVKAHGLGIGALVELVRSGDVIPEITKVIEMVEPSLPTSKCHWTTSGVDLVLDEANDEMLISQLTKLAETIECDGLRKGTIKKLVDAGFRTVSDIIEGTLHSIDGIGEKKSNAIQTNLKNAIQNATDGQLFAACPGALRGFRVKTVDNVLAVLPDILLVDDLSTIKDTLENIPNFGVKRTETLLQALPTINKFIKTLSPYRSINKKKKNVNEIVNNDLEGQYFVFSGIRDKDLEKSIVSRGGTIINGFSKKNMNTTSLIVKTGANKSSKMRTAEQNQVPIIDIDHFKNQLNT